MKVFYPADILLPKTVNMTAWSVIACDQFTSQPEYWERVEEIVGKSPSTYNMILPEAYLNTDKETPHRNGIVPAMEQFLGNTCSEKIENSFVYVERTQPDGRIRHGLVGAVDLECYDYKPGNRCALRATEGTVESRLPARVKVRSTAPLELPHAMVLTDDRKDTVCSFAEQIKPKLPVLYDFDLIMGGGHIKGYRITGKYAEEMSVVLETLADKKACSEYYGDSYDGTFAFAVGDGNHSLAAAKVYWEQVKTERGFSSDSIHPARFALTEIVNIHDPALDFEPIHRVILHTDKPAFEHEYNEFKLCLKNHSADEVIDLTEKFCQAFVSIHGGKLDYIHGEAEARLLGQADDCTAVLMPELRKSDLFVSAASGKIFPRKSFSIGTAKDKRYYLECRAIINI